MDIITWTATRLHSRPETLPHAVRVRFRDGKADAHLVAMTDPGVKLDPDWEVYRDGLEQDADCKDRTAR